MNCIVYLLDGLSPLAIKNKNNKNFLGKKIKENYISKLQKNSVNFYNIFGYGETFSTTYELFTGKNIYKSYCDAFHLLTSFPENKNLGYYFKKNNFNTFFFRDPHENHPMGGYYGRYFNAMKKNFDFFCIKKKNKNYNFNNFFDEKNIKNFLSKKNNNFFIFHDYSLHDNKKAYSDSTPKNYLEAVDHSAKIVKSNLDLIKYNENRDTLIFLSDHGLNLKPHDQLHFNKKISKEKYEAYYKNLFLNEKIKITCFIKSPGIKTEVNRNYYKPNFIFSVLKNFAQKKLKKDTINKLVTKLKKNNKKIIISLRAAKQDPYNNFFLKNYFHCHLVYLSKSKKIAYSHKHKNLFFNIANREFVTNSVEKKELDNFVKKYFNFKNYITKAIILLLSLTIRSVSKLIKIF